MNKNLEDIARLAGVSRSTVSRVINDNPNVNQDTRRRVLEVIEQQQYRPHHIARALATRRTHVISLVIPESVTFTFSDPFITVVTDHVMKHARQSGYAVMLWLGDPDETGEQYFERILGNRLSDGVIVVSAVIDDPLIPRLQDARFPFIIIGPPSRPDVHYVDIDNLGGARTAVSYLIEQGRRRIGMITGPLNMLAARHRVDGYRAALEAAGLPFDDSLLLEGRYTEQAGYQCMRALLEHGVDALFAGSDVIALGAIRAIHERGFSIPQDISLIGFDDISLAAMTTPALTTVRQRADQLGVHATQALIDLVEGRLDKRLELVLPVQLVIRETCAPVMERR
jgi:DNA-binding LacI/PurR family transcriptional regulator